MKLASQCPIPNAYYCPKDNGWVILFWKASAVAPPLAKSYLEGENLPLPDQHRRKTTPSCVDEGEHPFGKPNKTHHFHKYEKAFDSHKLTTPYRQDQWHSQQLAKQKRRVGAIMDNDMINVINVDDFDWTRQMPKKKRASSWIFMFAANVLFIAWRRELYTQGSSLKNTSMNSSVKRKIIHLPGKQESKP